MIKTFDDPETALRFNSFLSRLEKLDVEVYEAFYGKIRGTVRRLEKERLQEVATSSMSGEVQPGNGNKTG